MMKVWVMQGSYEGEVFSSVHLTQKGCALACISDITEFLDIDDEETALSVMNSCYAFTETDGEQTEAFEWDQEKLKEMTSEQLWKVFGEWCEISWDRMSDRSYHIDGSPTEIQA
tara:strand:+ start:214 stop:555 length:342 start_codon:yes stop_codon:yes gene_type:complete